MGPSTSDSGIKDKLPNMADLHLLMVIAMKGTGSGIKLMDNLEVTTMQTGLVIWANGLRTGNRAKV